MRYGLVGEKLGHSFSKLIHEELADYHYDLTEVARGDIDAYFEAKDFAAINVTIPYKETVIPHLAWIEDAAKEIAAVNTVVNRDGKLYGYNTDIYGMTALARHAGIELSGKKVVILGSGGTAKTARACAKMLGAREVVRVSRTAREDAVDYPTLYERHADAEVLINTTPVGMYPEVGGCPVELDRLPRLEGVIDAVYNPLRTELVCEALARGINAEGGLYMLVAQAVRASEIFLDTSYPEGSVDKIYNSTMRQKENVVLIGMPSSGKSTVGRYVADALGRVFLDTDARIVENEGCEIPVIFKERGEEYFRDAEAVAVGECAKESSLVIATGGGAVLRPENVRALRRTGRIYFIDRPLCCLVPTDDRPLSRDRAAIEKRYRERYPIYTSVCDVHIDGSGTVSEVAERIIKEFCK